MAATVDTDVFEVLTGAQHAVTGNELARLAGRSYAQVYAVAGRMVAEGLVVCVRYGRTKTYRINNHDIFAHGMRCILATPARIESEIRQMGLGRNPAAETIALLSPAARRRVPADGEVDLLVVRQGSVDDRDLTWRRQLDELARMVGACRAMRCGSLNRPDRTSEVRQVEHARASAPIRARRGRSSGQFRTVPPFAETQIEALSRSNRDPFRGTRPKKEVSHALQWPFAPIRDDQATANMMAEPMR